MVYEHHLSSSHSRVRGQDAMFATILSSFVLKVSCTSLSCSRHLREDSVPTLYRFPAGLLSARTAGGKAGHTMDAGGHQCLRPAHRRQGGGEAARQPRLRCPRWPQEQDIMDTMPTSRSALPWPSGGLMARPSQ